MGSPDLQIHPLQILCPASLPAFSALQPSRMSVTLYFFWLSSSAYRVRIALYWKRIPEKRRGRRGRSHWCGVENGRGNSCNGTAHASGPSRGVTARGLVAPSAQRGAWSESLGRTTCFRRWRGSQRTVAAPGCDAVAYSLRIACPIVYDTKMRFFYSLSILIISPIAEGNYDLQASGAGEIWTKGGQSGGAPYNFNSAFMSYDGTGGGDLLGPGFANYVWGTTVSYAVWVNVQSFGSPAPLFANNLDASPPTVSFSLTVSSPSGTCTPMCVNYYVAAPGCTPVACTISASAPGLGVWFHVAMTYDGQTLSGYVSGILVASFKPVGGGALPTLPNAVMIASMKQRSGIFSFADGRLYSRSLSASEVVEIKAGGCVQSGLVAWYSLADYSNPWANQASSSCIPTPSFSQTRSLSPSQAPTVTLSPTASITPSGSPTISLTKSVSHSMSRASRSRSASISISPSPSVGAIRPLIFSGSPTARPPAQPATGLSEGDIIGIVVGVVGVLIAAAVVLFYYFWPRRANGYIALMSLTLGTSGGGANSINNDGHSSHDTRRTDTCVVCMDSPRTTVLLPCGHRCVCGACTSRLLDAALPPARRLCPICRAVITATVVPYD